MFILLMFLLASSLFLGNSAHADWAYKFVVNDGNIYIPADDQEVEPAQIGSKIGKVTRYSDHEATYSGNFSNSYPKGTGYYKINDVDVKEAIAIKTNSDTFIRANYEGRYAGANKLSLSKIIPYVIGVFLLALLVLFMKNNWRRKN